VAIGVAEGVVDQLALAGTSSADAAGEHVGLGQGREGTGIMSRGALTGCDECIMIALCDLWGVSPWVRIEGVVMVLIEAILEILDLGLQVLRGPTLTFRDGLEIFEDPAQIRRARGHEVE